MICKHCKQEQKYSECEKCRPDILHTGVYITDEKISKLRRMTEEQNELHEDCPEGNQANTEKFMYAFGRGVEIGRLLHDHGFNDYDYRIDVKSGEIYGFNKGINVDCPCDFCKALKK